MNCCTRRRVNNQTVPFLMRKLTYKVVEWLFKLAKLLKDAAKKMSGNQPKGTLPSLFLIPYLVSYSRRRYKVMTWDILSSYRPGMESLHGAGHICGFCRIFAGEKNENKSTCLVDINEITTIKSLHRICVPVCSPNMSLSSGYRGQLCCQPMEGRQKCCVYPQKPTCPTSCLFSPQWLQSKNGRTPK